MQRNFRRHQNTLIIEGIGILALGIWAVIRSVMSYFFIPEYYTGDVQGSFAMSLLSTAIYLILDIAIRFYILRSAVLEARGTRRSRLYLILTVLICICSALYISMAVYIIASGQWHEESLLNIIVSLLIELTSIVIMIDFIRSAVLVRKKR